MATKTADKSGNEDIISQFSAPNDTVLKIPASIPFAIVPTTKIAGTEMNVPIIPAISEV